MGKGRSKTLKANQVEKKKVISGEMKSTDNECSVWIFKDIDKGGKFSFDLTRKDFQHYEFMEKMIAYSGMTWAEIKSHTHDNGKSKHHAIPISDLSKEAQDRFKAKRLDEYSDSIFSFALNNKLRIIGIRKFEKFHVLWYDPNHEVCPSNKKHT